MAGPSAGDIQVAVQALKDEAGVWSAQGKECTNLSNKISGLNMSSLQIGALYMIYANHYHKICQTLTDVTSSGGTAMEAISSTLAASATMYENQEAAGVHAAQNEW